MPTGQQTLTTKTMSETNEAKASNIHTKLLEFQKLNVSIKKGKQNPHFKSQYADINEVLEKIKEPLSTLGVVVIQIPQEEGLRTVLHDTESGTEIESFLKYTNAADPQKLGSHITYYRRYSLVALLGLEDDDDDGNGTKPTAAKSAPEAKAAPQMTPEQAFKKLRGCISVET